MIIIYPKEKKLKYFAYRSNIGFGNLIERIPLPEKINKKIG